MAEAFTVPMGDHQLKMGFLKVKTDSASVYKAAQTGKAAGWVGLIIFQP